jgi:hypothetical protein
LPPEGYFRLLLIGCFEGLDASASLRGVPRVRLPCASLSADLLRGVEAQAGDFGEMLHRFMVGRRARSASPPVDGGRSASSIF